MGFPWGKVRRTAQASLVFLAALILAGCGGGGSGGGDNSSKNAAPTAAFDFSPSSGPAPLTVRLDAGGSSDTDGTIAAYAWTFGDGETGAGVGPSHTFAAAGTYTVTLTVTDDGGATDTAQAQITAQGGASDTTPPTVTLTAPVTGATLGGTVPWTATAADDTGVDRVEFSLDGAVLFTATAAPYETSLDTTAYGDGLHALSATAYDGAGNSHADGLSVTFQNGTVVIPPAPATVATELPKTESTPLARATSFLYTGSDPIQTGVVPGTIEAKRVAVLRGKVLDDAGAPIEGVRITVLGHTELGQTVTRTDGMFDLAVNGGGLLTLNYAKTGFLTAQRQIDTPWEDYRWAPDVVLKPVDLAVTTVTANASSIQVARGTAIADTDGTRQSTLLIPPATTAEIVLADGSTQPVTTPLHIRSTEYTVGTTGPEAMPAQLPPYSGYTYAVELTADEVPEGAELHFNQPLYHYVENFIGFPVGSAVPTGYYDRKLGQWIASENGRVIEILEIRGGAAILDTDGNGLEDDATTLAALDVTPEEQQTLAGLYPSGLPLSLWRTPIPHFSPWDHNWPYGPPGDAELPKRPPRKLDPKKPCKAGGSIIECQTQLLGEQVPVVGTPYSLVYSSDRASGFAANRTLDIPLTGDSWPASLETIELEISIAGRNFREEFVARQNLEYRFTWDGLDGYGRAVQGSTPVTYQICSTYPGLYYPVPADFTNAFNRIGGGRGSGISFTRLGRRIVLCVSQKATLGGGVPEETGIAPGWRLNRHHFWDTSRGTVYLGNGDQIGNNGQAIGGATRIIASVAGNTVWPLAGGFSGDGGSATDARLFGPRGLAIGPDGSIYISDSDNYRIRRIGPDGIINTIVGSGIGQVPLGDGGPATDAFLNWPAGISLGAEGSLYIADRHNQRIRRVGADGIITTVAGNGTPGFSGDGGPAVDAQLSGPEAVFASPDGSIYIADSGNNRIRRVASDGIITTVAGNGIWNFGGDNGLAVDAELAAPGGVFVDSNGSLYVADTSNHRIRRVDPAGIITTVAGNGISGFAGDGGPATSAQIAFPQGVAVDLDGNIWVSSAGHIRLITPNGIITTVAGIGYGIHDLPKNAGDGGLGTATFIEPIAIAIGQKGDPYFSDVANHRIRRLGSTHALGLRVTDVGIPSSDGSEIYVFNSAGKHLRTNQALSSAVLSQFSYDTSGHLLSVEDGDGNTTTIERDAAGVATAILAPNGQRTELAYDANGYLAGIMNPAGETTSMSYDPAGLLETFATPSGAPSLFTYDDLGRLTRDTNPDGGYQTFARTDNPDGFTVTRTTSEGRTTDYTITQLTSGDRSSRVTYPDGSWMETVSGADANQTTTYSDGTEIALQFGPDPRFGMLAPMVTERTITAPSGLVSSLAQTVTATYDPTDSTLLTGMGIRTTVDGRVTDSSLDVSTLTLVTTEPDGAVTTTVVDDLGRVVQVEPDVGIDDRTYTYDALGLLTRVSQGTARFDYGFDAFDRVASVSDPLGNTTSFSYDDANRMIGVSDPVGDSVTLTYDIDGRRTAVTQPSADVHQLTYSDSGLFTGYDPPDLGLFEKTYNTDGDLTVRTLPSGATITLGYDSAGFQVSAAYPSATTTLTYAPNTNGMLANMTHTPTGGGTAQTIDYAYDGGLLTDLTFGGVAVGHYQYTFTNLTRPDSVRLDSGADTVNLSLTWNDAFALTGVGDFVWERNAPGALVSQIHDTAFARTLDYDTAGRVAGSTVVVNTTTVYDYAVTRDAGGAITQMTETTGAPRTYDYTYDADRRLTSVSLGATQRESYGYDANGNRTLVNGTAATFGSGDRVTAVGSVAYTYDTDGFLIQRGDLRFTYSALGELLDVTLADSTVIRYAYDGMGRRTARTDAGGTRTYLYGNPDVPYQVTAMRDETGDLSVFYYDDAGALYALDRGGARYYIGCDPVGTPKIVADATGAVVKTRDFDSAGRLLNDDAPGFLLPFGFAGGLFDPDTQLVRFWHRDYDLVSGQWTTHDPALYGGGQFNLLQYAQADPVNQQDPSGLWCIGFSAYVFLGGGAQVCCRGGICSACGEVGVGWGLGGSLGSGGPARGGSSTFAEAGVGCGGVVGAGLSCSNGDCGASCTGKASVGPYQLDTAGNVSRQISPKSTGCGLSAKAGKKKCERW